MLCIKNARVLDPASGRDEKTDLLLHDGRIVKIGAAGQACDETIDAEGLVAAPGLVDTHVHFRDPGFTHKEDLVSGARSAARGGYTTVVCMANTAPVVDRVEVLRDILDRAAPLPVHVLQAASVTVGQRGQELTDFAALREAGAACFSDDGIPIADSALLLAALRQMAQLDVPVSLHEEHPALLQGAGVNEGPVSRQLGLPGAAAVAEDALVARDCVLALETGARVVVQHISSRRAVALVRWARAQGARVEAEATPHHFSLTEDAVVERGSLAKMNPPLRAEEDRRAILRGLADDTIRIIATDHAPHACEEKEQPLGSAPSGIIGLETALALGITHLVQPGHLSLPRLLAKMTCNPAACYGLDAGVLREGAPADVVLIDPSRRWTVGRFASKSANSPFVGRELCGRVVRTLCGGRTVYALDADPLA